MTKSIAVAAVFIIGFANAIPNGYYQRMRMHGVPMVAMYPPPMSAKLLTNQDCDSVEIPVASEGAMSFVYGAGDHVASGGFVAQTQLSEGVDSIAEPSVYQEVEEGDRVEKVTEIVPEASPEPCHTACVDHTAEDSRSSAHDASKKEIETKITEPVLVIPVEIESDAAETKVTESKATESSIKESKFSETTGHKVLDTTLEASESSVSEKDVFGSTSVKVYGSNTNEVEGSSLNTDSGSIIPDVETSGSSVKTRVEESSDSKTSTVETKPVGTTTVSDPTLKVSKKTSTDVYEDNDKEVYNRFDSRRGGTYFPIHFGSFPGARSSDGSSVGVVSIANSYSTGRGGVASSHATAHGNGRSASSS